METGVAGLPGLSVARPAEVVPKPEFAFVTVQLQSIGEQPARETHLNLKHAMSNLANQFGW
jgi:hypothetical protein